MWFCYSGGPKTIEPRVKSRPTTAISVMTNSKDSCPICFEDYDGDANAIFIGVVKSCEHYFHFDCLWEWLEHNSTCPMCRNVAALSEEDIKGTSFADIQQNYPSYETTTEITNERCDVISVSSKDSVNAEVQIPNPGPSRGILTSGVSTSGRACITGVATSSSSRNEDVMTSVDITHSARPLTVKTSRNAISPSRIDLQGPGMTSQRSAGLSRCANNAPNQPTQNPNSVSDVDEPANMEISGREIPSAGQNNPAFSHD